LLIPVRVGEAYLNKEVVALDFL